MSYFHKPRAVTRPRWCFQFDSANGPMAAGRREVDEGGPPMSNELRGFLAERVGFEPTEGFPSHDFQSLKRHPLGSLDV